MKSSRITRCLFFCTLFGLSFVACSEGQDESSQISARQSDTFFDVTGDVDVTVEQATATMVKIAGRIPAITVVSSPASIKKLGSSYSVNLFFSNEFEPKTGSFPVRFSYRNKPDTLGGSFIQRGGRFSHDTNGTVEFVEIGDQVRVRFEFQTYDTGEGRLGRQGVTVKGEAVAAWADIF